MKEVKSPSAESGIGESSRPHAVDSIQNRPINCVANL